jgi:arginase family enzyme
MWINLLKPVPDALAHPEIGHPPGTLGQRLALHTESDGLPELKGIRIAFFSVDDDRGNPVNRGCRNAGTAFRQSFYPLYAGAWDLELADLGHLPAGATLQDTGAALAGLCQDLLQMNIIPFVLGGTQDLAYWMYRAYDQLEQSVNLGIIDNRIALTSDETELSANGFLGPVISSHPYNLFNLSIIGLQAYFVAPDQWDLAERMHFETYRLGAIRGNIQNIEPAVRDTDMVVFNNRSIRHADAPGHAEPSPNGLTADEACAIARYCGLSDKVSSFGYFEYNPSLDPANQNAHLTAQIAWYFIEGVHLRRGDYPFTPKSQYLRFTVLLESLEQELVFYKSPLSERWWMEVPLHKVQYARHAMVPCSVSDYNDAMGGEIPERWWKAQRKGL